MVLLGLILFTYTLANLKDILVPIAFSLLLAILLNPLNNWFMKKGMPVMVSITLCLLLSVLVIAGILYFISAQLIHFSDQLPLLKQRSAELFSKLSKWLQDNTMVNAERQNKLINNVKQEMGPVAKQTLGTAAGGLSIMLLLPVYTAMFLYYKTLILNFLFEVFAEKNSREVSVVLQETKGAVQSYMVGLLVEALIVAAMNVLALWLLGVPYALLIGCIGALLNMVPYIGGIIAILLPLLISMISSDGIGIQAGIVAAYLVIQFIDNNLLVPLIVSSKVKINAMLSVVIVLLGNALWGIPGMFLSLPFIGVLKIIFDKVPDLQPWGRLLGTEVPVAHKGEIWLKRLRRKAAAAGKK